MLHFHNLFPCLLYSLDLYIMLSVDELEVKLLAGVLCYSSSVYVEGDIETRVYNDSISSEVKSIPEICIRRDGIYVYVYVHVVDPDHHRFFYLFLAG